MMADQIKTMNQGATGSQAAHNGANGGDNAPSNKFKLRTIDGKVVPVFEGDARYNAAPTNGGTAPKTPRTLDVANLVDVQRYNERKAADVSSYAPITPASVAMPVPPVSIEEEYVAPEENFGAEYDANLDTDNNEYDDYFDGGAEMPTDAGQLAYERNMAGRVAQDTLVADHNADKRARKNKKDADAIAKADAYKDRDDLRRARQEALLTDGKREADAKKAAKKAKRMEEADKVVVETMESYSDVEVYEPTPAEPVKAPKAEKPAKQISTEDYDNHLDGKARKADKKSERAAKKSEQLAFAGAYAVASTKKVKPVSAPATAPVTSYEDGPYGEGYDPDFVANAQAEAARASALAEAENARAREAAKRDAIDQRNAKNQAKYETATDKDTRATETKAALISHAKADKQERKLRKAGKKSAAKSAKTAAPVVPVVVFADHTELFDQAAYDADKQAIANAEAEARAQASVMKADAKATKSAVNDAKRVYVYDKHTGKVVEKSDKKENMLAANKQRVSDNKVRKANVKEAKAQAKAEAKAVVAPVPVFADFTELFDQAAYDADKQATAQAVADAKAEAVAMRAEAKVTKAAQAEAKRADAYDKHTGKVTEKSDKKEEMLAANKQRVSDNKVRKAIVKEAKEAKKLETAAVVVTAPDFLDFTDSFDQAEYDSAKKAIADAEAKAKADAVIAAVETKRQKVATKSNKDLKSTEKLESKLAKGEMITFAKGFKADLKRNKSQLARSEKLGKFMLEYGSTYDPEWDGEFNNYGLPETDPLTDGVKLAPSRVRTAKKEKLSGFNASKLNALSRSQRNLDNKMVAARVHSKFADLELEVAQAEQDFSGEFKTGKEKRWIRDSKKELKSLQAKVAMAEKYERLDNDRYYSVVGTNFDTVDLPRKADRDTLRAMREELMRLLDIRDELNSELIQLYTGTEKGDGINHIKRRNKVVLKARKRAYVKYSKYCNALNKHRATHNEKMRIFDKLDEIVELSGEIARIKYILRKEKPTGKGRREYVREKGNAKSNLRYAKRFVERASAKAIRKAKKRQHRQRVMIATFVILALIVGLVGVGYFMGPQILEAVKPMVPENFQQYIDNILGMWPR